VLVVGRDPRVNRSVVEPLVERGLDAHGFTPPDEASDHSFNRLNAITRQPAGDYQPGQLG
jgi:hypothetical protein